MTSRQAEELIERQQRIEATLSLLLVEFKDLASEMVLLREAHQRLGCQRDRMPTDNLYAAGRGNGARSKK